MLKRNNNRPNTLMVLIWDMGIGGVQKRVRDLILDIEKNDKKWTIHLLIKRYYDEAIFIDQIEHLPIKIHYFSRKQFKLQSVFFLFWLAYQYISIKPTVSLTFLDSLSFFLILVKRCVFFVKSRVVLNEGAVTSKFIALNRSSYWNMLVKWSYKHADLIIAPTNAIKKDLIKNYSVPKNIIEIIPNWSLFPKQGTNTNRTVELLYVGRYEPEKDPLSFIFIVNQLVKKYPNIKTVMLGSGSLEPKMINLINNLGLKTCVSLYKPQNPVNNYLQSKILVLTSLNEGMPNVVIEAALCLVPTVTNNFAGSSEVVVDSVTGYICSTNHKMVEKITLLLSNENKLLNMAKSAQTHAIQHFGKQNQKNFISALLRGQH